MVFIHPTAEVEADVQIGENTKIWHLCHIRRGAHLGANCVIGRGVASCARLFERYVYPQWCG